MRRLLLVVLATLPFAAAPIGAQRPTPPGMGTVPQTTYQVTFPEPEHHWLQVEATYTGLGNAPLDAHMSRSSPGRYAVHEFAKNVFSFEARDGRGRPLAFTRPDPYEWAVAGHDGTVHIVYKLYGDLADGTYLAVDTSHAHMNMPATFMWAQGYDDFPIRVTFTPPAGLPWKVGTQLYSTSDPFTFTAPNLQYFMDSPTEFSDFVMSTFAVPNADGTDARFRVVAHADGSQADVDELAALIRRLVREEMAVYGEFPQYEPGYYTFLLDYLPYDRGDGMEHRNSTFITQGGVTLRTSEGRQRALDTIAHEYFHNWNVERIRPVGLEPFDFTRANMTCCLWLAEGFTQYYGELLLIRAGYVPAGQAGAIFGGAANAVVNGSGRLERSAVEMSEYAPFSDAAASIDPTDRSRTFISYYTYGEALAAGLDLSLREQSGGRTSLDDFMRLMWRLHGKPGGPAPGLVGRPYSLADLRDHLAELTGSRQFAEAFFAKDVEGHDVLDYAHLFSLAGFVEQPRTPPQAGWTGTQVQAQGDGLVVGSSGRGGGGLVPFGTPAYDAGLEAGDVITTIDGAPATIEAWNSLRARKPGDRVRLTIARRGGLVDTRTLVLKADPSFNVVPIEQTGGVLTDAQRVFRERWLGTRVR